MSKSKTRATTSRDRTAGDLTQVRQAPAHPGAVFRLEFRQAGTDQEISQAECARRMRIPVNRLNEFEKGKRGLTPKSAWQLAGLTGTTPEFWMGLQTRYELWQALQAFGGTPPRVKPMRQE